MGVCQNSLDKASCKKSNNTEFMNKTPWITILNESKLRKKYLKSRCKEDQQRHKKERNLCIALY